MWGEMALGIFVGCALFVLVHFVLEIRDAYRAVKSSSEERKIACIDEDIRVLKYKAWAGNRRAKK